MERSQKQSVMHDDNHPASFSDNYHRNAAAAVCLAFSTDKLQNTAAVCSASGRHDMTVGSLFRDGRCVYNPFVFFSEQKFKENEKVH